MKLTNDEKKLVKFAKENFPKFLERRRNRGLYDTYCAYVLSDRGDIYEGTPFISSLGSASICAERVAIANMVTNETEKAKIKTILLLGPVGKGGNLTPCGLCRSVIYEFSDGKATVLCAGAYFENTQKDFGFLFKKIRKFHIKDLYPSPWNDGNGINMESKLIPKKDLSKTWKLLKEYVDEKMKLKEIKEVYSKFPKLFVGCYHKDELIGICIPGIFNKEIYIRGIAVKHKYWRKGIGSKLLKFFEQQLRNSRRKRITVPSANIDWVEKFYLKNKYKPIQFLVKVKTNKLPEDYKNKGFKILNERKENNYKMFYIKANKYDPKQREKIKKMFNAEEVIYIMEKKL